MKTTATNQSLKIDMTECIKYRIYKLIWGEPVIEFKFDQKLIAERIKSLNLDSK